MSKSLSLGLLLLLCFLICSELSAQSLTASGKIPDDLVIKLFTSYGGGGFSELTIDADGSVAVRSYSSMPPSQQKLGLLTGREKKMTPELRDRLSKRDLREIIKTFDRSGFFYMNDQYDGDPAIKNRMCTTHSDSKGLSITAGGRTKSVGFDLGCDYGDAFFPLKDFLTLFETIRNKTNGVKKKTLPLSS